MSVSPFSQILNFLGPLLYGLVFIFGIVIALINLSRVRGPAMMALLGCLIVLVVMVGQQVFLRMIVTRPDFDHQALPVIMSVIAIPSVIGHALIIWSVFSGRKEAPDVRS